MFCCHGGHGKDFATAANFLIMALTTSIGGLEGLVFNIALLSFSNIHKQNNVLKLHTEEIHLFRILEVLLPIWVTFEKLENLEDQQTSFCITLYSNVLGEGVKTCLPI